MSTDFRTTMATRMLTAVLPNGDIAADMLLSANITEPVKMQTPPNPAKCQHLIRGGFVKAATLAMSTDDPATLEKLARHASLGVKLAVVKNPAATDAARRIVEAAAIKRSDSEMLIGVLSNADIRYVIESLRKSTDLEKPRYSRVLDNHDVLGCMIDKMEHAAAPAALLELLECDPKHLSSPIGRALGKLWPVEVDLDRFASVCTKVDLEYEMSFLNSLAGNAAHFDKPMVDAIDQLLSCCERKAPQSNVRTDARLRGVAQAATYSEEGRNALISLCPATARIAYSIDPRGETLAEIAQYHGEEQALSIALKTTEKVLPDTNAKRWMLERICTRGVDGNIDVNCDMNSVVYFIDVIEEEDMLAAALRRAPRNLAVSYLSGQFGEITEQRAKSIASTHPVDVIRGSRMIRQKPWGKAAIETAIEAAPIGEVMGSYHYLSDEISLKEIETLLVRVCEAMKDPEARFPSMSARPMMDAFAKSDFADHMDRADLPGDILLNWLSICRNPEFTLSFIKGARRRKLSPDELDRFIENPGEAWGHQVNVAISRVLQDLIDNLPIETVDRIVDGAGNALLEYLRRQSDERVMRYLIGRINRSGVTAEEWMTAFELFAKSPASVGAAISAAKRLGRARNNQQ